MKHFFYIFSILLCLGACSSSDEKALDNAFFEPQDSTSQVNVVPGQTQVQTKNIASVNENNVTVAVKLVNSRTTGQTQRLGLIVGSSSNIELTTPGVSWTLSNQYFPVGSEIAFSMPGLSSSTNYWARGFAQDNNGNLTYGNALSFRTSAATTSAQLSAIPSNGLNFGSIPVGTGSSALLRITNTGTAIANFSGSGLSAPYSGFFGTTLAPQVFYDYNINFNPTVSGTFNQTLIINYNGGTLNIPITGSSYVPLNALVTLAGDQAFTTNTIDFGTAASFQTTKSRTLYIKNTGNQALVIQSITSSNASIFRQPSPTGGFPITVQPNTWYGIGVVAARPTPTGTTARGTYTVNSNASNAPSISILASITSN